MYAIHRVLGTLLSILFLVWFLSAFVMMYHGFPRVNQRKQLAKQEFLREGQSAMSLLPIDSVLTQLPPEEPVMDIALKREKGRTALQVRTFHTSYTLPVDTVTVVDTIPDLLRTVKQWCDAPIARVDTMYRLDQWIPFGSMKKELPIYKYHFADAEKHQLYIGSQSGKVLQFTDRDERFWAWLGAIPHWVYFTRLRQDLELWSNTVIALSGIGCIMVIAGIWVAVDVWRKSRRRKAAGFSPYRKKWYHWHYVSGIFFGIFVLTFVFSGMMSLAEIPSWISHPTLSIDPRRAFHEPKPQMEEIRLDYRLVLAAYPDAKQVEWSNFCQHPYYTVKGEDMEVYIDATDSVPRPLQLSKEEVEEAVQNIYEKEKLPYPVTLQTERLDHFETYYRDMSQMYKNVSLLPVWKITADDEDHSVYYVNPQTGAVRYVNTTARWKYWTYPALHRMRIAGLNSNVTLRKTVLWILLLGGTVVSTTGIVLSVNYLRRKFHRKKIKDKGNAV